MTMTNTDRKTRPTWARANAREIAFWVIAGAIGGAFLATIIVTATIGAWFR